MAKISITDYFSTVLTIDGQRIDVQVRRMGNREFDKFATAFAEHRTPRGAMAEESTEVKDARDEADREWFRQALRENLAILPGQIEYQGVEIPDSGALVDLYGGRPDVAPQALTLVWAENYLSEEEKKTFRSVLDSSLGFTVVRPTLALGNAPGPTAASAAPSASAAPEAAMGDQPDASCGTTAPIPDTEVLASV